ncbi:MAG TPA: hypothetical protein VGS12_14530 [Caulobacteraceae bacterium]|nr:hypothetical protein [Caulobacteraceae bacterium]
MPGPIDWDKAVLGPTVGVFGEGCTYYPAAEWPFALTGVFDRAYRDVNIIETDPDIVTVQPVLGVRLAAFPLGQPPAVGDKLYVPSVDITYLVREVRPDGHGWAKLMLNATAT